MRLTIAFATPVLAWPPPPATKKCLSPKELTRYIGKSDLASKSPLTGAMLAIFAYLYSKRVCGLVQ